MYELNNKIIFFIIFYSVILYKISVLNLKRSNEKILILFSVISITLYSGIGMSFVDISNKYIFKYIIFLAFFVVSIRIGLRLFNKDNDNIYTNKFDEFCIRNIKFFKAMSIVFIFTLLIHLFLPTIRINQLWNPPKPTLINIFERSQVANNGIILNLADVFNIFLKPIFFIYLFILKQKDKYIKIGLWLIIWCYLNYLKIGYMSRNDMIILFIFITLIYGYDVKNKIRIKNKYIIFIGIMVLISIPFLLWYESFRLGANKEMLSFGESLKDLFIKECDYPKYYPYITQTISPIKYILWLIFLPFPSMIFPWKPTLGINTIFSQLILGIQRGSSGYYVLLPSILGEGFLIYGDRLYWIHAIIVGIIIGIVFSFISRYKYLTFFGLFYAIYILTIARGGSQGYIASIINSCVSIILLIIISSKKNEVKNDDYIK